MSEKPWTPDSWKGRIALQQPTYADPAELERCLERLARLPPLVTSWEIETLKSQLAAAARGESFLLQGGDCAESFENCTSHAITNKLKILLQMSLVLVHSGRRRVIRVGRFAGQYAKPRSSDTEIRDGVTLPSYRGDLVNSLEFDAEGREPDPYRLLQGYKRAALTLNFIRGLIDGGFADLHHPEYWDLDFVQHSPRARDYQRIVESIGESLRFMETLVGVNVGEMDRVDFYASHEGLHLSYEQAQTRQVPRRVGWYNLSTHLPWIGLRTAAPDGAHVEFFRGVRNPIGLKVGASTRLEDVDRLLDLLHPDDEPGRLTLIHRFGADKIQQGLGPLVRRVRESGKTVLWCCDPMHGNTRSTASGLKTRRFDDILRELELAFEIHAAEGSLLGGVHFELTGEDVTECVGGARGLDEVDLHRAYRSQVDPRLNYEQALEMALLVGERIAAQAAPVGDAARLAGTAGRRRQPRGVA
ncbi:MAG: 3-deoxy-7-phosphoheptulonate synthase class II [Acidobacteria bacterium]|nr:MAG: 3-deoxy-7-phosphoheptulonate synthase class II [Acidobacteriota bacterium]REK00107.1 MAG: 3-deoxy-7-phosphoheptulonate synthase class II [Acidobacteriota bacterium]